jgi:hypothetical protein
VTSQQIQSQINSLRRRAETGEQWADICALEDQRVLVAAAEQANAAKFEGWVADGSTEHGYAVYSNVALS